MTKTDPRLSILRCPAAAIEEAFSTRQIPTASGQKIPMGVYIPREEGDFLYSIVRHVRPRRTIEVGLANGLSAGIGTAAFTSSVLAGSEAAESVVPQPTPDSARPVPSKARRNRFFFMGDFVFCNVHRRFCRW